MATTFHGRAKYFLTFIDDFFRKTFLYTMKLRRFDYFMNKLTSVLVKHNVFKHLVKNKIKKKVEVIRCHGSDEYNSENFNIFYKDNGIMKQITIPCMLE
jgi:hypothetical protein